jgi:hypothetical protein
METAPLYVALASRGPECPVEQNTYHCVCPGRRLPLYVCTSVCQHPRQPMLAQLMSMPVAKQRLPPWHLPSDGSSGTPPTPSFPELSELTTPGYRPCQSESLCLAILRQRTRIRGRGVPMCRCAPGTSQYAARTRQTEALPQEACRAVPCPRHYHDRAVAQFVLEGLLLCKRSTVDMLPPTMRMVGGSIMLGAMRPGQHKHHLPHAHVINMCLLAME